MSTDFYSSKEWRLLRYEVIKKNEARCSACGRTPQKDKITIHLVKSISFHS